MQKLLIISISLASLVLNGCSLSTLSDLDKSSFEEPLINIPWAYRMDIIQGNKLTQEQVNQLKPGMTEQQVRFVMGTPMIQDPFHHNRWDYIYYFLKGGEKKGEATHVSLIFDQGRLAAIKGTLKPEANTNSSSEPAKEFSWEVPIQVNEKEQRKLEAKKADKEKSAELSDW